MIIVTRAQMKFLNRGRALTLPTTGHYHKGRTYAVTTPGHRTAVCRAQIIDLTTSEIHIRLATIQPPRLLARSPIAQHADYVTEPARAMHGEPEAIDFADQTRFTELGTLRWRQLYALRQNEALLMTLRDRIRRLERAHATGHTDFTSELRLLRAQARERETRP